MILLDTHVLTWFREGDRKLGSEAIRRIEIERGRERAYFSVLSLFEIGVFTARGKIKLTIEPASWRDRLLNQGFAELDLDADAAVRATQIAQSLKDPFDALLVAVALTRNLEFVTADERILAWKGALKRLDARR